MALCKLEKLRILKLRGCHRLASFPLPSFLHCHHAKAPSLLPYKYFDNARIGECFAYTALATRFGFNNVEVFDLRDTNIGDTEVQCFGRKEAVLELLVGGDRGQKITDR